MSIDVILDYINENRDSINPQVLLTLVNEYAESAGEITDATAVAVDILQGKVAYNNSGKVTGSMATVNGSTITPSTQDQIIQGNKYLSGNIVVSGSPNLLAENIKSGINIFGVTGSYTGEAA